MRRFVARDFLTIPSSNRGQSGNVKIAGAPDATAINETNKRQQ